MDLHVKMTVTKSQLCRAIYITLFCLTTCSQVLASSNIATIITIPKGSFYALLNRVVMIGFLFVFLIGGKLQRSKLYIVTALSIVVVAVTYMSQNMGFAVMYLAILAYPSGLDTKRVAKWISYSTFMLILIILFMNVMGCIPSDISVRGKAIRNSCGFVSANAFSNTMLIWLIAYIYYRQNRWKIKNTLISLVFIIGVYFLTNSRMAFIVSMGIIIVVHFWTFHKKKEHKLIFILSSVCYSAFTIFCFGLTYLYEKGYYALQLSQLNIFMSFRLGFMRNYYREYGIRAFGQIIKTVSRSQQLASGEAWRGLDNSYMYIMICWGFVLTLVLCFLYLKLGQYLKQRNDYIGALCVVVLCIVGITESYLTITGYNLAVILIAQMISQGMTNRKRKTETGEKFEKFIFEH